MKILKVAIIFVASILLGALLAGYWFLSQSKPDYQGEVPLEGLHKTVEVYYDEWGIPHIFAQNEHDVYLALGYVHAQDRLFQMEMLRRVGGGRLAEIFGPDLVPTDRFMRTIGINEVAKSSAEAYFSHQSAEGYQQGALAYLKGVNYFLHHGKTPPEYSILGIPKEDFTPADLFRIVGYMGFSFNSAVRTDPLMTKIAQTLGAEYLGSLQLETTPDNTTIPTHFAIDTTTVESLSKEISAALDPLPVPIWNASNSWVVGGNKSEAGLPLLSNDTHIGFQQPAVWYEAHLNYPGFEFYGNHLAGFPFALVGHNDFCAWGLTIFPNDDLDFYREKPNPDNPLQVWNQDHWEDLMVRDEVIKVKGQEEQLIQVRSSRHGPIINEVNAMVDSLENHPVSLFWTFTKFHNRSLQMAYQLQHSQSMEAFREALSLLDAPGLNVTYADRQGNIAWWTVTRLVKRPPQLNSKLILDGSTGYDDPLGWYPFEENPRSENPPSGFVYSANNQPDTAFGVFHPGYYFPGARGERIMELLSAKDDWNLESFSQIILDDQSPIYPSVAKTVVSLIDRDQLNETEEKALEILAGWDGRHALEQPGPTIYYRLSYQLQKNIFADELGEEDFSSYLKTMVARRTFPRIVSDTGSPWWDDTGTGDRETREQIIVKSYKEAIALLVDNLGDEPSDWQWKKVHFAEHQHPIGRQKPFNLLFNVGPYQVRGGDEVINKMPFDLSETTYSVRSGPAMRILIDLADMDNSLSVLPTGQSGHPMSPHYRDQAELYHTGKFRSQLMGASIKNQENSRKLILTPK